MVGMRLSLSGTHIRVSSSVDQMTCRRPVALAAAAIDCASAISFSGEKCAQKNVTQYAPYAPSNALFRLPTSSTSAATTSAPSLANSFALAPLTSLVSARAVNPPLGSFRIALTMPPPCAPVAPNTAITLFSAKLSSAIGVSLLIVFLPWLPQRGGYHFRSSSEYERWGRGQIAGYPWRSAADFACARNTSKAARPMAAPVEESGSIESFLPVVGGNIVYASGPFAQFEETRQTDVRQSPG